MAEKRDYINNNDFTGKVVVYSLGSKSTIKGRKFENGIVTKELIPMETHNSSGRLSSAPPTAPCDECGPDDTGGPGIPLREVNITTERKEQPYVFPPADRTNPIIVGPNFPVGNPNSGGGGSGGGGTSSPSQMSNSDLATAVPVNDGKPKIKDIKKYTGCFNDGKEAKNYTMTIYANQPVPGTTDWYKIVKPGVSTNSYGVPTGIIFTRPDGVFFDVGHTFVTFEKNNTDGTNVRQTLGFYPSSNPISSKGAMEDNGGHDADVSFTINVTKEQFQAGLKKVESDFATKDYVLTNALSNEYNCTDAAISWMNAAGAKFEDSTSGLFKNTPANFGRALKNKIGVNLYPGKGIFGKGPCD
ncbi:hypothetical protein [Pedobacter sp. WC2423]|uniref:hypothetical protein n=1 Tax=Pedobacter sp. WC2423 TaxID=3234142 RepID=UPI0034674344